MLMLDMVTPGYKTWSMQGVIALSKKDNQTGGLRVRPGSHIFDYFPDSSKEYEDAIDVNLEKGDMVIFSSQLHHATYESQKKENTGWSLNLTYRSWWCKQQFDLWSMIDKKNKIALNDKPKVDFRWLLFSSIRKRCFSFISQWILCFNR